MLLEFIHREAAMTRPDEKTFTALRDAVVDRITPNWREQAVAAWALGGADLTEAQQKEAAELLAFLLDYGGRTRREWQGENWGNGIIYGVGWGIGSIIFLVLLNALGSLFQANPGDDPEFWLIPLFVPGFISLVATPLIPLCDHFQHGNRHERDSA